VDQEFDEMYRRYAEDVFRYALLVLRSRPDAEDATQTTFLRAYGALQRGERVRKPHNWLIKIAHNECRRHLSSSRRTVEVALDPELVEAPETDDGPTAEEIRKALSHLSFNQRAALVMRELEDRTYAEIAEVLDVSVSAVETLLFRARRALREQMEGALECGEAEALLSRQLDGELSARDRRLLRAHTRACGECATLERRQRGRRAALRRLGGLITLPSSLSSFVCGGGGSVAAGAGAGAAIGLGAKVSVLAVAALTAASVGASGPKPVTHAATSARATAAQSHSAATRAPATRAQKRAPAVKHAVRPAAARRAISSRQIPVPTRRLRSAPKETVTPHRSAPPATAAPVAPKAPEPAAAQASATPRSQDDAQPPPAKPAAPKPNVVDTVTNAVAPKLPVEVPRIHVPAAPPAPSLPETPTLPATPTLPVSPPALPETPPVAATPAVPAAPAPPPVTPPVTPPAPSLPAPTLPAPPPVAPVTPPLPPPIAP
jgi:RNA polymerase sigma factor (sigma-70 family)